MSEYRINTLARKLEQQINNKIEIFNRLGKQCKEVSEDEQREIMQQMTDIVVELQPCIQLVKLQNPHLTELFDSLLNEYETKKQKKCPTCHK